MINSNPKTVLEPNPNPKNSSLGPKKKAKNNPKIQLNLKVKIEGMLENKSCSTMWVDPKIIFKPNSNPKNSPLGPPKAKNDPKIQSNVKVRI